ncbi:MAG: sulfotransferase [Candidatus Thiodiazotropha sp. (ex Dulcina madagascariensis)]|nr:sulfotransferase [Candidatus Thiodiazotropha sp. (ex Dulcina madagascariensis)]
MTTLKYIVFVVGASRSGTTMLNRILGRNLSICALNELHYFGDLYCFNSGEGFFKEQQLINVTSKLFARKQRGIWNDQVKKEDIEKTRVFLKGLPESVDGSGLFHRFIEHVAVGAGTSIVAEQTPRNIYYAADLLSNYNDVRILHIIRDPRAVIASQKRRWSRRKSLKAKNIPILEVLREWISYHPYTMCLLWRKAFIAGRNISDNDRYMRLRFEDLVDDSRGVIRQVCDFLEVPFDETMLEIEQTDSSIRVVDNSTIGIQKVAVDTWKTVLSAGEVILIERILINEMRDLSYNETNIKAKIPYLSLLPLAIWFPLHLFGTFLINPQRFIIQLRGILFQRV